MTFAKIVYSGTTRHDQNNIPVPELRKYPGLISTYIAETNLHYYNIIFRETEKRLFFLGFLISKLFLHYNLVYIVFLGIEFQKFFVYFFGSRTSYNFLSMVTPTHFWQTKKWA